MTTTTHAAPEEAGAPALKFTDAAARKVGDLIRGEGNPNLMLRVSRAEGAPVCSTASSSMSKPRRATPAWKTRA